MDILLGIAGGALVILLFWGFSAMMEWLDVVHARLRRQARRHHRQK